MKAPVTIVAPAKLTLSLRVVGVRDDGYHLIDAVLTTLDLHDEISLTPIASETELTFVGAFAAQRHKTCQHQSGPQPLATIQTRIMHARPHRVSRIARQRRQASSQPMPKRSSGSR